MSFHQWQHIRTNTIMNIKGFLFFCFISTLIYSQNKHSIEKSVITKNFILGKFDYKSHELFELVNPIYTTKAIYLNKDVYSAFLKMNKQAEAAGISLKIISGTRNFSEQKIIWERKWKKYSNLIAIDKANKILEYSSMPSTSRHHWGTDIDLNSFTNSYFEYGKGKLEYLWLLKHANAYGFYQVYTSKNNGRTGYNLERWHWSYMPLANRYLRFYNKHINASDIIGFKGAELATELHIIHNFVNGISSKAKTYIQN